MNVIVYKRDYVAVPASVGLPVYSTLSKTQYKVIGNLFSPK